MTELGINGLAPGFKYDVRVRGIFNGQPGEWSPTYEIDVFSDTSAGTGDKSPAAITDLTVTPTIDSFIITWSAPTRNVDGTILNDMKDYVLEVSDVTFGTADATYLIPEHNKPSDLSAVDRAHQFEFTYKMNKELYGTATPTLYARIYARDTTNNRSAGATANATNSAPSAPGTPSLTPFGGGIAASWTAGGADTVEYVLRAHTASMANPPVTGTEVYRGTVLNFNHITTGTKYYRVGAVDIFGQTTWSNEQSATPGTITVTYNTPVDPTGFTNAYVGPNYRIGWTASASSAVDVKHYKVDVTANATPKTYYTTGTFIDIDPGAGKDFGANWPYTVTAATITTIGPSGLTSTPGLAGSGFVTAPATPAAPDIAAALGTTGERGINITWTAPSDPSGIVDSVEIYAGTTAAPTTPVYSGNSTSFTFPVDPTYNGTYYFRSRVKDKFGRYSAYSSPDDTVAVTTLGATTVGTVTGSLDTADPTNQTAMLNVTWTNPTSQNYAGTKLRYRLNGTTNWTILDVGRVTSTLITNLVPAKTYNLEVIAYDFNGTLGNSGTWTAFANQTVTADAAAPSQPTAPSVAANTMQIQVTQAFTKQAGGALESDVKEFEVYAGTAAAPTTKIGTMPYLGGATTTVATFDVPASAASGSTQAWIVRTKAVDYTGNASAYSPDSSSANVNLISTTNIADATITNAKIGSVDAGKITTGTLDAARIGVGATGANFIPIEYCGFENRPSTYTSLFANTAATTTVVATQQRSGSQALQIVTSSTTTETYFAPTTTSYNMVGAAGETYIVSLYVKANTGTPTVRIRFKSSTGAVQDSSAIGITTSWTRISAAFLAPTSTTGFQVGVASLSATGTIWIDDVMVEKAIGTGTTPSQFVSSTATVIDGNGILTGTVNANRLEANSAVVTDLTVGKTDNTPGTLTVQGTGGKIKSNNYVALTSGWQLDQSGLDIAQGNINAGTITAGTISAARLALGGNGTNILPSHYADFEVLPASTFWTGKFSGSNVTASIVTTTPNTGSYSLSANCTSITTPTVYLSTGTTTYNFSVKPNSSYIISAWIKAPSGTPSFKFRLTRNTNGATTSAAIPITASMARYSTVLTTGANDTLANLAFVDFSATGTYIIDSVMVEEQVGGSTTPSAWENGSTTIIDGSGIAAETVTAAKIDAAGITADKIQVGGTNVNLLPPQWSDFEFKPFYYVGKMDGQNATATASTEVTAKFNSQSCKVVTTSATNTIFFAVSGAQADYNFKVAPSTTYIISAYIYNNTGANRTASFRYRFGAGPTNTDVAATVDDPGGPNDGTTTIGAGAWYRIYATVTTGTETNAVLGIINFNAAGTYYIDGVMVEKRVGNQSRPSPWVGSPQTIIDGGSISTSSVSTDKVSLGLFASNLLENGSFEKTGTSPQVEYRKEVTSATAQEVPGWTLSRWTGDANSWAAHEWGDKWSIDPNVAPEPNFEDNQGLVYASAANTGDVITSSGHGLSNGNAIIFKSVSATNGLTVNQVYYVISATTDTFQVSTTYGGGATAITADSTVSYLAGVPTGYEIVTNGTPNGSIYKSHGTNASGAYKFGKVQKIIGTRVENNKAIVFTEDPTDLVVGDTIDITGVDSTYNYSGTILTAENHEGRTTQSLLSLDFGSPNSTNVILLSTEQTHELEVGDVFWLSGLDNEYRTLYDGPHIVYTAADEYSLSFVATEALACTFQDTGDTVTYNNHGLVVDDKVIFKSISGTTGINTSTVYYVKNPGTNTFQVSTTPSTGLNSTVALTTNGSGTFQFAPNSLDSGIEISYNDSNVVTFTKVTSNVAYSERTVPGSLQYGRSAAIQLSGSPTAGAYYGISSRIGITPDTTSAVTLSFWYKVTNTVRAQAYLGPASLSGATSQTALTATTWTKVSMQYSPATTDNEIRFDFRAFANAAGNNGIVYIDGVQLIERDSGQLLEFDNFYTQSARSGLAKLVLGRSSTGVACTFQDTGDTVTKTTHGFVGGEVVVFSSITSTTGISVNTPYYVKTSSVTANTFQLCTIANGPGGAAIALTTNGSGTYESTGTKATSDVIAVSSGQEYAIGMYYYGDKGAGIRQYLEYSASLPFSASKTYSLNLDSILLPETIYSSKARSDITYWRAPASGYVRLVVGNGTGTTYSAAGTTIYVEDVWFMKTGATSGELTDAGIRLFDTQGKETISLMSDSGDGGDFMQFGSGIYIDGTNNTISANTVYVDQEFRVDGNTIEDILWSYPRGIVARAARNTNSEDGGIAANAYLELRAGNLDPARSYRFMTSPIWVYNSNGAAAATDLTVTYNSTNMATKPSVSDAVFVEARINGNNNQNTQVAPPLQRYWSPTISQMAASDGDFRCVLGFVGIGTVAANSMRIVSNSAGRTVHMWLEDIGPWVPDTGVDRNTVNPDSNNATKNITKVFKPKWVGSYQSQGNETLTGTNHVFQGDGRSYGNERSAIRFDTSIIPNNSTILKVELYMYCYDAELSSGVDALIGIHRDSGATPPNTWAGVDPKSTVKAEVGFSKKQGAWVDITNLSGRYGGVNGWSLASSRYAGVTIGPGTNSGSRYVGAWVGKSGEIPGGGRTASGGFLGRGNTSLAPRLRITYKG